MSSQPPRRSLPRRVLLTGMSGTGNSSVLGALGQRGFRVIDMDDLGWAHTDAAGHQLWNESRLRRALLTATGTLFVSGCAENQVTFYPQFSDIILLSAPPDVLLARLRSRTNNRYGKRPEELQEVLANLQTVEPLLRRRATCEIDTTVPLAQVVEAVLNQVSAGAGNEMVAGRRNAQSRNVCR